jgi:hypothetical protein
MSDKNISALLHILNSEQQITARTDQKAFTMLSILGVFMVFFIVHFLKLEMNLFFFIMVVIYFISSFMAIVKLVTVIVPRVHRDEVKNEEIDKGNEAPNPTYFGGISQYENATEYALHMTMISESDEKYYQMFAEQVYSLGKINTSKNLALRGSIYFFVSALVSELLIIMMMAWMKTSGSFIQSF